MRQVFCYGCGIRDSIRVNPSKSIILVAAFYTQLRIERVINSGRFRWEIEGVQISLLDLSFSFQSYSVFVTLL